MKYVLTKNGTYAGEFDNHSEAMLKAQSLEKMSLEFKGDEEYWFAFGPGHAGTGMTPSTRNEYEICLMKKRRA